MQLSIFFIVLLSLLYKFSNSQVEKPRRCNISFFCSSEEKPVWATPNGWFCEVFRNECIMLQENCIRRNTNKPEAKKITKTKCQALCRELVCLAVYDPVCGIYNGNKRTFGNDCEMGRYICRTGQTYTLYRKGVCRK